MSSINLDYVAKLARVDLTPDEKVRFSRQLGDILGYVEQLQKLDVTGLEASSHPFENDINPWAEDVPGTVLANEAIELNAPAFRDAQIVVPKVIE